MHEECTRHSVIWKAYANSNVFEKPLSTTASLLLHPPPSSKWFTYVWSLLVGRFVKLQKLSVKFAKFSAVSQPTFRCQSLACRQQAVHHQQAAC